MYSRLVQGRGDRAYPSTDAPRLTPKPNTPLLTREFAHSRSATTDILLSINNLDIGRHDYRVNPERFRASLSVGFPKLIPARFSRFVNRYEFCLP